jgi:dipeptide/tripeptide permease
MQSAMTALAYLLPVFSGVIVDRWVGARYLTPVGMAIAGIGYYMGSVAKTPAGVYVMIFLIASGLALFKNGLIMGRSVLNYDSKLMDSAYTIRYAFVNVGGFIGPFLAGILYKDVFAHDGVLGFAPCFRIAAIVMFVGVLWYIFVVWRVTDECRKPFKLEKSPEEREIEAQEKEKNKEHAKGLSKLEKKRIAAIGLGCVCAFLFWIFWYLAYLPIYYYWGEHADWIVLGYEVPMTWFDAANGLFCIILAPLITALWKRQANSKRGEWSMFRKSAVGIGLIGVAYLYFLLLDILRGNGTVSAVWLLFFAILLTAGEMVFSPASGSFLMKFSPTRYVGILGSLWSFATFFSTASYGYVYGFLFSGKFSFGTACIIVAAASFVVFAVLVALDKRLSALLEKDDEE